MSEELYFEYLHRVGLEETNAVGNVYFSNFISWQGRCREFFLVEHCPEIMNDLKSRALHLVTRDCSCKFLREVFAGDVVSVRMTLNRSTHTRLWLDFDYVLPETQTSVAHGTQVVGCVVPRAGGEGVEASGIPPALQHAVLPFQKRSRPSAA